MTDESLPDTAREELLRDRRVESWLILKGLLAVLVVLAFAVVRQRYLL